MPRQIFRICRSILFSISAQRPPKTATRSWHLKPPHAPGYFHPPENRKQKDPQANPQDLPGDPFEHLWTPRQIFRTCRTNLFSISGRPPPKTATRSWHLKPPQAPAYFHPPEDRKQKDPQANLQDLLGYPFVHLWMPRQLFSICRSILFNISGEP